MSKPQYAKINYQKKGWMISGKAFNLIGMHFIFLKSSCVKVCAVNHILHVIHKAKTVWHCGPQRYLREYCVDVRTAEHRHSLTAHHSQQVCAHPHKHTHMEINTNNVPL